MKGKDRHGNIICPDCEGSGYRSGAEHYDAYKRYWPCETCNGRGYVEYDCPVCKESNEKDEPGNCDMCSFAI